MSMWPSQSVQCTWFVSAAENVRAHVLFEELFGTEPDTMQQSKSVGPTNPFFSHSTGKLMGMNAIVQVQPGRVDAILAPDEGEESATIDTDRAISLLSAKLVEVPLVHQSVSRIALVVNLFSAQADEDAAQKELFSLAGITQNIPNAKSTVFQVNSPVDTEVGTKINRLVRYSSVAVQKFVLNLSGNGIDAAAVPASVVSFGVQLMLDFNTVPDGFMLTNELQPILFRNLVSESLRVAADRRISALNLAG